MKKILMAALLAPSLLAGIGGSGDPEQVRQSQLLTLRVYNYAGVEDGVLGRAKRGTSRIFAHFGIHTDWLDCPTSPEQIATNRACSAKPGADHLILKLLPKSMSKKYGFKRGIFGFALPTANGAPGNDISLFYAQVLDLAYNGGVGTSFDDAKAIILGHMIAHEVGHLLLGPDSHGASGVMSFPWNKGTLTIMERGLLEFTATERSTIRRELDRRSGSSFGYLED